MNRGNTSTLTPLSLKQFAELVGNGPLKHGEASPELHIPRSPRQQVRHHRRVVTEATSGLDAFTTNLHTVCIMDAIRVRQSNNRQRGKAATQAGKAAKKDVWEVVDASDIQSRWHISIGAKKGLKSQLRMRMEDRALERPQQMGHLLQQTFDENSEKAIDIILDSNRQQLSSDTLPIKERMIASLDKMNITDVYSSLRIQRDSFTTNREHASTLTFSTRGSCN
eukprot:GHVU01176673.1.p1 GENE.GHVU01176673.1~~GHVU01176673.1.p1  ORF type:complete len:223 (+),score=28.33 GHVU01176673.1:286-954(+)